MLLLLIPLCASIVEGDDVGKFELCIEFVSELLYGRDAARARRAKGNDGQVSELAAGK